MRDEQLLQYIGTRLKTERERLGYSQKDFASLTGCSQAQYSRFERGEREPGVAQIYRLTRQIQAPLDTFLPAADKARVDTSAEELIEAWRGGDLRALLALIAERFA